MIHNFLSLDFQQPPIIEERCHFKLLTKHLFQVHTVTSEFHFYMPHETSGQSLLLALSAGYCTVYFGINTSKRDLCRHSSLEGKSFILQYLSITYLAGEENHDIPLVVLETTVLPLNDSPI